MDVLAASGRPGSAQTTSSGSSVRAVSTVYDIRGGISGGDHVTIAFAKLECDGGNPFETWT